MAEYEGVKLYTDVTQDDINETKKNLLKEMALTGNRGMKAIQAQSTAGNADEWNRYNQGLPEGTPETLAKQLDEERSRMLGGLYEARKLQSQGHSEAMDRMAARNVGYLEAMPHAAELAGQASQREIAAMKAAAEARAGGGGGGGGGYTPAIGPVPDTAQSTTDRLWEIYATSAANLAAQGADDKVLAASGVALERNAEATLQADFIYQQHLQGGVTPAEATDATYQWLRSQGISQFDSLAIAHTLGQNYGDTASSKRIINTAGGTGGQSAGVQNIARDIPGLGNMMRFLDQFRNTQRPQPSPDFLQSIGGGDYVPPRPSGFQAPTSVARSTGSKFLDALKAARGGGGGGSF